MSHLFIDCESYSSVDLKKVGAHAYAEHPDTEVILWSVHSLDWPRPLVFENDNLWVVLEQLHESNLIDWTRNTPLVLTHWGAFDRIMTIHGPPNPSARIKGEEWNGTLGPHNTVWVDMRQVMLTYGGPAALKNAAAFFGDGLMKDEGASLISRWCKPDKMGSKPDPSEDPVSWERFRSYAGQDTQVMGPLYWRFASMAVKGAGHTVADHAPESGVIQRMNERGVPIDLESVGYAKEALQEAEAQLTDECVALCGFRPSQPKKIAEFLELPNCQKATLEEYLRAPAGMVEERVAQIRLEASGAARKKLDAMQRSVCADGRVRGCFDFHGAWTSRLTSFLVQFQNMVRSACDETFFEHLPTWDHDGAGSIFEEVRSNIRGFIKAPEGKTFVAADYNAIELRVGAWLSGEKWLLDMFVAGGDPYLAMASDLFNEHLTSKEDPRRQMGKIVELASLFQLGGRGLAMQTWPQGIDLRTMISEAEYLHNINKVNAWLAECDGDGVLLHSIEEAPFQEQVYAGDCIIKVYRQKHPNIVQSWWDCQDAFKRAIQAEPGFVDTAAGLRFERQELFIKVVRPSGFGQYYWMPELVHKYKDDGTLDCWDDGTPKVNIRYIGRDKGGRMSRTFAWGGSIYQGGVQGTAADLLRHGMGTAEAAGFPPVMQIHDEVVCEIEEPELSPPTQQAAERAADSLVGALCKEICKLPDWAEGLPVEAEGWIGKRFTK